MEKLRTDQVFGISNEINPKSYVDRGDLDKELSTHLQRPNHVVIRGASKSGKTWLRQSAIKESLVIQCRLEKTVIDIYREALSELGVRLQTSKTETRDFHGSIEAQSELGARLLGKVILKLGLSGGIGESAVSERPQQEIHDLKLIAELIKVSGKKLVIEDFHYLSQEQRKIFAFDLKTLWDYGLFVVIIGVWSESNLLLNLNHDLTGRVREVSIVWDDADLQRILEKGGRVLNVHFSPEVRQQLIGDSYGNSGILQHLTLDTLDRAGITCASKSGRTVADAGHAQEAAMFYAEELNTTYQSFANSVASGIRTYRNSTGIYGHALAVIFAGTDIDLLNGIHIDMVYRVSHKRQPRIQKGNLRTALENFERLQVDKEGRGLVLSYADEKVRVVDRQLLLYRRYSTVRWPWEDLIAQADSGAEPESYEQVAISFDS